METKERGNFVSVGRAWEILKKNWMMISIGATIGGLIALIVSFVFMVLKYSASSDILVNQKVDNTSVQYAVQQADLQAINTYKDILKKPIILDTVLKELKQKNNYAGTMDDLKKSIAITNSTNSQVVTVTATDTNAYTAADMANMIAEVFKRKIKTIMKVDNVTVVSKATVDTTPVSPNKKLNILLGLVVGALLGTLVGVIKELMDTTVKGTDFLDDLGLVNLGSAYHISSSNNSRSYRVVEIVEDADGSSEMHRRV